MVGEEQRAQKRQTACKIRIKGILNSKYIKNGGFNPNYIEINSQEVSRVNVIGVVVDKSGISNHKAIEIDDGTGKISARYFENNVSFNNVNVGDVVLIIGRPREFSSEKYILIETIKKIDPTWAKVRKLELKGEKPEEYSPADADKISDSELVEEKIIDDGPANKVIKLIKELDKGEGVAIEDILSKSIKDVDKITDMLLKEGDIFEIKPGKLKVLE